MYSEMEGWLERRDHPLLNDLILNNLFEFVRSKDFKSCRLVCKKWCVLTLPSARSKYSVKLHGSGEEMTRRLTDFIQVFRENKLGIPFVEYDLGPFCTTEEPGQEFIQICGSTAKKLSLIGQKPYTSPQLRVEVEDVSELLKAMPKLASFCISQRIHSKSGNVVKLFPDDSTKPTLSLLKKLVIRDEYSDETSDHCPTFIEEVFSVAPNVSDVKVLDSPKVTLCHLNKSIIGRVLKAIEKFERQSVITNLCFTYAKTDHFDSLRASAENGLKLKNLSFTIFTHRVQEWYFNFSPKLATLFRNSIEQFYTDEVCTSFLQFPQMSKVESLDLMVSADFDSKCVNLNKLFPALKALRLHCWDFWDNSWQSEEFLPNSEPCVNVKSLFLGHVVKIHLFHGILNIFPKLTKLHLGFRTDGRILRKIMTQMTQLEDLSLSGMLDGIENMDALYTGIPLDRFPELQHVVNELKEMTVELRADTIRHYRDRYCQFPSFANLTKLKRLHSSNVGICVEREGEPTKCTRMTDIFLYFGLHSMKHIKHLEIELCEFTRTGCEILTAEMDLETWKFTNEDEENIIPEQRSS